MKVELISGGITLPYKQTCVNYVGNWESVSATRCYTPSPSIAKQHQAIEAGSFALFHLECTDQAAAHFRTRVAQARASHGPLGACLHLFEEEEYQAMDLFLDVRGLSGFAIRQGEVVSLFGHKLRKSGRSMPNLLALAVEVGGSHLTCFDTGLVEMYEACGFWAVARTGWQDHLAPTDWSYAEMRSYSEGRPDVVTMLATSLGSNYFVASRERSNGA